MVPDGLMSGEVAHFDRRTSLDVAYDVLSCVSCNSFMQHELFQSTCSHILCYNCLPQFSDQEVTSFASNDSKSRTLEAFCPRCDKNSTFSESFVLMVLRKMRNEQFCTEEISCANCDQIFSSEQMFYCETCRQSLCADCKVATHSARMFASHKLVSRNSQDLVIKCCNHPDSAAIIANTVQNEFVCVRCFSDFPDALKSSCGEISLIIQSKLDYLSEEFERLKTNQAIVKGRMLENQDEFFKFQKTCENNSRMVSEFAQKLIDEVRKVEAQLTAQLTKDIDIRERNLEMAKDHSEKFASSVDFYVSAFEVLKHSDPNKDFLKLVSEFEECLRSLMVLKTDCMSFKVSPDKRTTDFKTPFKRALDELTSHNREQNRFAFDLDPLKFQNFALMRSLSQDPSQIQKLLDMTKPASPMLRLASPGNFTLESSTMNRSLNSSCSLSSSSRAKLCPEAEQTRNEMKEIRKLYASNVSKVQSLQLDVTRRKVYPKKVEAERLCSDVENFTTMCKEFVSGIESVKDKVGSNVQSSSLQVDNDQDFDFTQRKLDEWCKECKDLLLKHEQMKQILKSIKPYILSVTKQKEKSNTRLTPVVPIDHLEDLKRSVVVDDSVQEQRIQAIEAMYKSQSLERAAVNSSEIQKELQLTKQKLKKAKCNPPSTCIQLGTALEPMTSGQEGVGTEESKQSDALSSSA